MTRAQRLEEIFSGAAIAVLLLVPTIEGAWAATISLALLAVGLLLFRERRQIGTVAAGVAVLVAVALALSVRLLR